MSKGSLGSTSRVENRFYFTPLSEFTAANPGLVSPDNAMGFISDDGGETYNRCHCENVFPSAKIPLGLTDFVP